MANMILFFGALVASTVAVPVSNRGQCARYCTDESDFTLLPGNTYTYDYETTTVTAVQGGSQDKTQMQMTAQAEVQVISKCELALRLRAVTLKISDPRSPDYLISLKGAREFATSLEKYVLKFSYQNGQVEHVCPSDNAPAWITNIQKGVLSAFQTYKVKTDWTTRTTETDVLGRCTAEYHSMGESWQGTHTIRKMKDLSSCTDRENVETYLQGTPYAQEFNPQSLPVVRGHQECEQVIGSGFLQTSTCNEKLVFRPFSSRNSGVVTTVTQKLVFAVSVERIFTGNDYRSSVEPLLFKHAEPEYNSIQTEDEAKVALKTLCDASKDDITISVPRHFSTFIYKLKKLNHESLKLFYQKTDKICPDNTKAKKFFMDAIPLVGTTESARFMFEMIRKNLVSESESKFWLTSLSFVSGTTKEIIATFTPLLNGVHDQAILGVSALVHNFCKSSDCSQMPEVRETVRKLTENLGESCINPDDKKVILSLKAIGNIGHLFGLEDFLQSCYKNPQIRTETRLAAIEAFRRASCDINRNELMNTYSNYDEETEIRIAAYLAVMRCPSHDTVLAVKDVLLKEKINHVGSFIWTHLSALSKTKHPERQEIRDIVSDLYLMNKYASDARKFSSAHEAHFYLESLDSGVHVDSNVIFSTDSYLPKTAMFNLTLDVFGKTCNLFQIDGRLEGLEHVVESFFGPGGYFPQKNVAKLLRERRSLDNNKLNSIDSQFRERYPSHPQPYGSVDLKVFGTSMWYGQFRHHEDGTPDINLLDMVTRLAQETDQEYSRSFNFLDTTFTVPMTSGLPLKIALNGTASVALKIGGKFDVKSMEHVDVVGHFEPSGAVEISGLLSVDAGSFARSGLRIVSTMHSSTVLDGKLKVKNGQVINAQLNMPREKIEIFDFQSKLYLMHGSEEREKTRERRGGTDLKSCTGQTLSSILGLQVCTKLQLPAYRAHTPLHPLNGPASFSMYLQKTDPSLRSYNFDAQWKDEKRNGGIVRHGIFSVNTPESKTDRDISVDLMLNQPENAVSLKVKTPIKKFGIEAKLVNSDSQKKLDMSLSVDGKNYISLLSNLAISDEKYALSYTPSLEVHLNNKRLTAVSGSAEIRYGHKYAAQIQVEDLTQKPIVAKGTIELGKRDRYDVEMSISSFPLDGTVKGYAQLGDNLSTRFTADYRVLEGKMNKLNILGKMKNLSANALTKYTGMLNIQASVLPEWNTEVSFETMSTVGHYESTMFLSLGDGVRSRKHTVSFQEIIRYEGSLTNNKVDTTLKLSYPERNVNYELTMKHENTERSLRNQLQLQYDANKKFNTDVDLKMDLNQYYSASGDLKLKYQGRDAFLKVEMNQPGEKEYRGILSCQWQQGRKVGGVIHYRDRSDASRLKYEVEGNLQLPRTSPIAFSTAAGYHNKQMSTSSELVIGGETYKVKADYAGGYGLNQRVSAQVIIREDSYGVEASLGSAKDKYSGNLELRLPKNHKVTAKFEGRLGKTIKFGSFETYWDAERDTNKRFAITSELRERSDGYEGKASINLRRKVLKGSVSTSFSGKMLSSEWKTLNKFDLEWSPTEKVAGVFAANYFFHTHRQIGAYVSLATPFYEYENVSLNFESMNTPRNNWEHMLSASLPRGNELTLSSTGKFSQNGATFETKNKFKSSLRGLEDMSLDMSFEQGNQQFKNKAQLKWGTPEEIAYQFMWSKRSNVMKSTLKLNTPLSYFRGVAAEIEHEITQSGYKTRGEYQSAMSKRVAFKSEASQELRGRRRFCTINIEAETQFRGYENTGFKMTYDNSGVSVNTISEVYWNRNKINTSLWLANKSSYSMSAYEGKLLFTSPFGNYDYFQILSSMEMNSHSGKMNVDSKMFHGATATLNSQWDCKSLTDLKFNVVVAGQYPGYMSPKRAAIDVTHKLSDSKLRTAFDGNYNTKRLTMLLTGGMENRYGNLKTDISVTLNTPFKYLEEVKAEIEHIRQNKNFNTKVEVNVNNVIKTSLLHKMDFQDILNFNSMLEATHSSRGPTSSAKLSIVQSDEAQKFAHTSFFMWDRTQKIELDTHLKKDSNDFTLKLTTPFRKFSDLELKSDFDGRGYERNGMLSARWNRGQSMTLSGKIKNIRWQNMDAMLSFESVFKGHELYTAVLKYNVMDPTKTAEASFLWNTRSRKSVTFKGNFFHSSRATNAEVMITTPFANFKQMSLTNKYEQDSNSKKIDIMYQREQRKISVSSKVTVDTDGCNIIVEYGGPFQTIKECKGSFMYRNQKNSNPRAQIMIDWNNSNKYEISANYETDRDSKTATVTLRTPIEHFEVISAKGIVNARKMSSELSGEWDNGKRITVTGDIKGNDEKELNLNVQTPFKNYESMVFKSKHSLKSNELKGFVAAIHNGENLFEANAQAKYGGAHLIDAKLTLDSTLVRFREMNLLIEFTPDRCHLKSSLKWAEKEADISFLVNRRVGQLYEASMKLNTPTEGYENFKVDSRLENNRDITNVRLNMETTFDILRTLDIAGELKGLNTGYFSEIKVQIPGKMVTVRGRVENEPLSIGLDIEAPFMSFRTLQTAASINYLAWDNAEMNAFVTSPQFKHGFVVSMARDYQDASLKVDVESTSLQWKSANLTIRSNYADPQKVKFEAISKVQGKSHSITGDYKHNGRVLEVTTKVDTSMLPNQRADFALKLTRRNKSKLEAEAKFIYSNSNHQISAKYENKDDQIHGTMKIDSEFLSSSRLESEFKYLNVNNDDMEILLSVMTPGSIHTVTGKLSNFQKNKFAEIKVECPLHDVLNPLSVEASFTNERPEVMDASFVVSSRGKEFRIAGKLNNEGRTKTEAFLTMNTPLDSLKMVRLDGTFRNDNFRNIDVNLKLETSHPKLEFAEITSKLIRNNGAEEVSLMLRLPLQNYKDIHLLGNVHYSSDYSSADSRITFQLSGRKYTVYGQYEISRRHLSGMGEIEVNKSKWVVRGRHSYGSDRKDDVSFSIVTPRSQTYTVGGNYEPTENGCVLAVSYNSPSNERYSWNSSMSYENVKNFGVDFQVETPFSSYRNIQGKLQQQTYSNFIDTSVEYARNGRRGFLKFNHRNQGDGIKGVMHTGCPYGKFRDLKLTYNRAKTYNKVEDTVELDYNHKPQMKLGVLQFGQEAAHLTLDSPVLGLTVSADRKKLRSGQELNLKSTYQSRIMSFRMSHQLDDWQMMNDAAFSWDERNNKKISYDFKLMRTDTGRELLSKIDTPLRSLILKGNFTQTLRSRSGGIDFYWDASRSIEKHVAMGTVYNDLSSGRDRMHKLQFTVEHPKLQRGLVQTNVLSYGPSEALLQSDFEYSRDRHHHIMMELKATDLSKDARDRHYKAEMFLKHAASRIDLRATGDLLDSKLESSALLQVKSLDRHQQQTVRELKGKIMKLRQEIEIMMRSNEDQMSVSGRMSGGKGETDISLEKRTNDRKDLTANIRYSRRNRAIDVSVMDTANSGVQISAAYPKSSATLRLSHSSNGNAMTDVHMFVGLEQSKILKSKLNWRPRLMYDLRIVTGETLRSVAKSTRDGLKAFSKSVSTEFSTRSAMLSRSINENLKSFTEEVAQGLSGVADDVRSGAEAFGRMYERNEFLMRDAVDGVNKMADMTGEFMNVMGLAIEALYNIAMEQLENVYDTIYYSMLDLGDYLTARYSTIKWRLHQWRQSVAHCMRKCLAAMAAKLGDYTAHLGRRFQVWTEIVMTRFDKWLKSYAPCIIDGYYYTKSAADKIRHSVNGISRCFSSNRYYVALRDYVSSVVETYQRFRQYSYAESAQAFLDKVYDMQLMDTIMNHPSVDYMSEIASSALKKTIEIYHNLGMDYVVSNVADTGMHYIKTKAFEQMQSYLSEFYRTKAGAKYDFSPERGHMSLEFTLPVTRSSLMDVFDFKTYPEYQKMISTSHLVAQYYEDFCIWDFYYKVMKYFTPSYWLPAFTARALISGNQHFVTFDKLHYDFAGRCSYLLARDFVDGNFTAIVNYGTEDHQRKSLTLLLDNRKMDIGSDYRVTLDDVRVELPMQVGRTVVIREGVNVRVQNDKAGFTVVCNFVFNFCSVSVSGFYYGKTAGLLGTFNYEPTLDWMSPSRYVMGDVESFAKSWEVGQAVCRSSDNYATIPANDARVQHKCRDLFEKSTSQFRACFKQVNPDMFMKMCVSDLSAVHQNNYDDALCQSAAAYFTECQVEGVHIRMPKHCVRCEKQNGSFMDQGTALQFPRDGKVESADVVFLVEEKACNRDRVRYLSRLALNIEENFRSKGYRDVRYRVVGFGGDRVHAEPHVHTMEGMESGPLRSLESALDSLEFGDGPNNILEAMRFAAALSYRPGTTKSFILVKCSTCKSEEIKAEYSEMLQTLLDGDISLHLLMDQKYEMRVQNKMSKARKVIGVDKQFAYTLKDVKDSQLSGDDDLLAQLRIPKDVCIPLAFEVNGSSFDSQFLTETKRNTNKKFMDVLARLVVKAASVGTTDWGMCCECLPTQQGVGKATCQRCVSEELATMISAETSGVYNQPSERRRSPR